MATDCRIINKAFIAHGKFPESVQAIVDEPDVLFIDLNRLYMELFTPKGKEYVTKNCFMNLPAGVYKSIPGGLTDNTHSQSEGGIEVTLLVYHALKKIVKKTV